MTGGKARLILQPRDRRLLHELEVLRLVDREQAKLFAPFTSTSRANARLKALTEAGYLNRLFVGTAGGSRKAIYRLSANRRTTNPRGRAQAEETVAHQLHLNELYYLFTRTTPHGRTDVSCLTWQRMERQICSGIPLIPDGYVELSTPTGVLAAFVEVDMGSEALRIWDGKIEHYIQLALSGEFERIFGHPQFRVLVVTTGDRRLTHIRQRITEKTRNVFWLTTFEALEAEGVWASIWQRPVDSTCYALIAPG